MHLTFGTGIFWLLLTSSVGTTIVQTAAAWRRRGREDAPVKPDVERRLKELEERLAAQAELTDAQATTIERLEEQVEFTHRLLSGRREGRDGAAQEPEPTDSARRYGS